MSVRCGSVQGNRSLSVENRVARILLYEPRLYKEIDSVTCFLDQISRKSTVPAISWGGLYAKDLIGVHAGVQMRFVQERGDTSLPSVTQLIDYQSKERMSMFQKGQRPRVKTLCVRWLGCREDIHLRRRNGIC